MTVCDRGSVLSDRGSGGGGGVMTLSDRGSVLTASDKESVMTVTWGAC